MCSEILVNLKEGGWWISLPPPPSHCMNFIKLIIFGKCIGQGNQGSVQINAHIAGKWSSLFCMYSPATLWRLVTWISPRKVVLLSQVWHKVSVCFSSVFPISIFQANLLHPSCKPGLLGAGFLLFVSLQSLVSHWGCQSFHVASSPFSKSASSLVGLGSLSLSLSKDLASVCMWEWNLLLHVYQQLRFL